MVTAESGQSVITYALLDNGSTNTFCSASLLQKLGYRGQKTTLGITTLQGETSKQRTTVRKLEVSDVQGQHRILIQEVYATSTIPMARDCIVEAEDLKHWEHLKDIDVPVMSDSHEAEMIIGQDCPEVLAPLEVRRSNQPGVDNAPFATRTLFRWTINGPLTGTQKRV